MKYYISLLLLSLLLVSCAADDSERVKELEAKINKLESEKNMYTPPMDSPSNEPTFNSATMPQVNNDKDEKYFVGDREDKVLRIQGTPTSVQDLGYTKMVFYGISFLTFENGTLISYSNHDGTLKIGMQNNNPQTQVNKQKTKYCYVYVETNEPELRYDDSRLNRYYYTVPVYMVHRSQIIEVKNYNEDMKYRMIDRFESTVRNTFHFKDIRLEGHGQCSIVKSECYAFNTYKEASEHRRANL